MTEISAWYVVLMGIGTVFVGLISIVLICTVMGAILKIRKKPESPAIPENDTENKEELLAVISAAIAASAKTDVNKIKIISVKKAK